MLINVSTQVFLSGVMAALPEIMAGISHNFSPHTYTRALAQSYLVLAFKTLKMRSPSHLLEWLFSNI